VCRFVASPISPGAGGSRLVLALGWGESIGSSRVVGVRLSSGAGLGVEGACCAREGLAAASGFTISRLVISGVLRK
jgi:hypothetical protein